jgi:tetratricopeptide (TPR) repeat protein
MKNTRIVPVILWILLCSRVLFSAATDVTDLGVPAGLSAKDYDNQGNDLLNKGDYARAIKYFDAATRIEPDLWTAYYNRATAFYLQKNWTAALQDLNSTIRLKPAFFQASWIRAIVHKKLHNYSASLRDLNALARATVQVQNPEELALTLNQRAWLYATCPEASLRNGQSALADAKRACEMDKWKESHYIDTLAAAYAEVGDFDSAVRFEERALNMKKSKSVEAVKGVSEKVTKDLNANDRLNLAGFSQRLELYKQHRPYRDTAAR